MRISRKKPLFPATSQRPGFTLMEVMAATAVLALLLSITVQITTQTDVAIRSSERQMKVAAEARTALDRFEADFSTAMLTAGATALVLDGSNDNSAIRFISLSRARQDPAAGGVQPRGALIGYGAKDTVHNVSGNNLKEGSLVRGDGRVDFSNTIPKALSSFADVFKNLAVTAGTTMNWESIGDGLLRFHISYVLDNGEIVYDPPKYSMISAQTGQAVSFLNELPTSGWTAVAFAAENAPTNGRYVVALKVAIAGATPDVIEQARKIKDENYGNKLEQALDAMKPPTGNQSALQLWETKLTSIDFLPLRQSIRFFQRTIPIP